MAEYRWMARTNYFLVKDPVEFRRWCQWWRVEALETIGDDGRPLHGFRSFDSVNIPDTSCDPDSGEVMVANLYDELAAHLVDGWVAIVQEVGYDQAALQSLAAEAVALNSSGERIRVDLWDIY